MHSIRRAINQLMLSGGVGLPLLSAADVVLDLSVRPHGEQWALHDDADGTVLLQGNHASCVAHRLQLLYQRHGSGLPTFETRTFGGRQWWDDRVIIARWRLQVNRVTGHSRLLDPRDVRRAWGDYEACRTALEAVRLRDGLAPRSTHAVVLLHGIGRSRYSMDGLAEGLHEAGYEVLSASYASTRGTIAEHAEAIVHMLNECRGITQVSFVTHSMGGLVARALLARDGDAWRERMTVGRLCMIFPPSTGAQLADKVHKLLPYHWMYGPAGEQLTSENSYQIPIPKVKMGVIAGGTLHGLGRSPILDGDDDGTVRVAETILPGLESFTVVEAGHTLGMNKPAVIGATIEYLEGGHFPLSAIDQIRNQGSLLRE